jgi:putative phosphonate metabolism protein
MGARYAVYYAPPAHSELWRLGCRWLGRDPQRGENLEQPAVQGMDAARIAALTAAPRSYGFHATLKPPFRLREDCVADDLDRALSALSRTQRPFALPPLQLERLGGFLALTPVNADQALRDLAQRCVIELDGLRHPPDEDELLRRRSAGLSERQERLLARWGYPYVLEEFRFHLSLTERVSDPDAARLSAWLDAWFAAALVQPLAVEDVSLYVQPASREPFQLLRRYRLAGGA